VIPLIGLACNAASYMRPLLSDALSAAASVCPQQGLSI